ncbi:MAG TPA: chromate resistance protein ChrB domain-containing protein [Candidatus Bathyarchaeia archaeon]|nr:chromate resistance protein ChrB domain-containing protein [Candidatus Bathyarchaeia archaeon]
MIWVTRNYVHVDRVACPWLIKNFIDLHAQFIFLPQNEIADFVEKTGAIPFDVKLPNADLNHYEENGVKYCTFDAIIKIYNLEEDEALQRMRKIVRAADTDNIEMEPLAIALEAIASGAPLLVESDHDALNLEFPFYDVLYTYLQREIIFEKYKDELEKIPSRGERTLYIKTKINQLNSRKLI